ncbi:hypothetical protein TWF481_008474 [Arthrobotrys musiformis]|uniref:MYND-type domain-containing protein n=1 Tax=Arthrobotrys musiformis TaxID=47236 RepID=A0AAV9WD05_9PEZI
MGRANVIPSYGPWDFPSSKEEPDDSCVMCNKQPADKCGRCKSVWYCSKPCQKKDWPSHKILCESFANEEPRPSPAHKRAIFFPPNEEKPQLNWVLFEWKTTSDPEYPERYEGWDSKAYFGKNSFKRSTFCDYNPITKRRLGNYTLTGNSRGGKIAVCHRDDFLIDGSPINQSILTSVGRSGEVPAHRWCGPIVVLWEDVYRSETHHDLNLGDFRHIMDFFITYGKAMEQ